jgi:hypothetical protein
MITTPVSADLIRTVAEVETTARGLRPHRLPAWVRAQFPDPQLLTMEAQPSGVRLVMSTTARAVELVTHSTRIAYRGTDRPRGRFDLAIDGEVLGSEQLAGGDVIEVDMRSGATEFRAGLAHVARFAGLPAGPKVIEIWLPHNESLELVELRTDAVVHPSPRTRPLWLHHGSSISHGSNAATPAGIWPAVAARHAGVDLRNLGFGGSAVVDPFMARVIRDAPADFISVKLGINVVNLDAMRLRAFVPAVHGFLDTIRDGHPHTPLVLISPIFCGIHEDTPGPSAPDPGTLGTDHVRFIATGRSEDQQQGRLTLRVIRDALASIADRRGSDPDLHYLDGTRLFSDEDAQRHPLADDLHPGTAAHQLIGTRFAEYAFPSDGPFGP